MPITQIANLVLSTEAFDRPTHVMHPTIGQLCAEMRALDRHELVPYAAASYRDDIAWRICREYLADRDADLPTLKSRAYATEYGWTISPADCRF